MRLDHAQLAAFAAVIGEGSFEAAARRLHVTPSAISQRIRLLEERLGQILVRRGTPCRATEAGQALARHTGQLALLEAGLFAEMGIGGTADDPIRLAIAVNADSLETWFLDALATLAEEWPVRFDVHVEDQDHSASLLKEGSVIAAVSASPQAIQGCAVEPLGVMRYRGVAAPGFVRRHFARGVDAASLAAAPLLTFNRKDGLQERFAALLGGAPAPAATHYLPSVHGFVAATRRGLGWGMMPELMLRPAMEAGELVDIAPGRWLDVPLYWHCWRLDSPLLAALAACTRRAALPLAATAAA